MCIRDSINTNAQNGLGYFDNIGKTIRQGLDLTVGGKNLLGIKGTEKFSWAASYGYLDATYDSDLTLVSDANSTRVTTTASYGGYEAEDLIKSSGALTETGTRISTLLGGKGGALGTFKTALDAGGRSEDTIEAALETLEEPQTKIHSKSSSHLSKVILMLFLSQKKSNLAMKQPSILNLLKL